MANEWLDWKDITLIEQLKGDYKYPGVYAIRLVDSEGIPVEIGRFLGVNTSGILDVGKSNDVGNRIWEFYHTSNGGTKYNHSEGERLHLIRFVTEFQKSIYRDSELQFTSRRLPTELEAKHEEERLLKCYFIKYGELPPLNCQVNDIKFNWKNPDCSAITLW